MSSITGVSSVAAAANPFLINALHNNNVPQGIKDFQAIGTAIQSGNLTVAQSALTLFQRDLQTGTQTATTQPFGTNTQANADFQTLTLALKTGDLAGAQKAFTTLQTHLGGVQNANAHSSSSFTSVLNSVLSPTGITLGGTSGSPF